jgi:O-antigen/teichoic acid export membrane protein
VSALIAIVAVSYLVKEYKVKFKKFDRNILKESLIYGLPVIISGLANWVLRFADRYVIQLTRNASEVGLYSVAYTISEKTIMLIVTAIAFTVTPTLIYSWEHHGRQATEKLLKKFTRYQFMILLPTTCGLIILAPEFMRLLVGPQFWDSVGSLRFVAAGVFFLGLYNLSNTGLYINKKTKTIARNNLLVGIFNVILNIYLVPKYGYIVAAINTMVSYFLLWLVSYFQTRNLLRWGIDKKSFVRMVVATFAMSFFLFLSKYITGNIIYMLAVVLMAILIYFLALKVSREIDTEYTFLVGFIKRKVANVKRIR